MVRLGSKKVFQECFALLFLFLCLALISCKQGEISVDENLVETFVEIRIMEQTLGTDSPEARIARRDILQKQGFTLETFKTSVDKILADKNLWVPFQKAVVARIDTLLQIAPPPTPKKGANK